MSPLYLTFHQTLNKLQQLLFFLFPVPAVVMIIEREGEGKGKKAEEEEEKYGEEGGEVG